MNGKCVKVDPVSCKKGKKRCKTVVLPHEAKLNDAYYQHDLKTSLQTAFKDKKQIEIKDVGVTLHDEPFQCCQMLEFLSDERFLTNLKDELLDQIFFDKNNDLYSFQQTNDLKKISTPYAKLIREFFCKDFRDWLCDVTGITLTSQVDLTCSKYDYTDVLLCHDDELDTRRFAFVLYLVQPWTVEDGGLLDLFNMDENGEPKNIAKSLVPAWNSLTWFEVTEGSHHQVSEVLSEGKSRLSVNGWYHSVPLPRPARYVEPSRPKWKFTEIEEEMVYNWLNPIYLEEKVQLQIREKFEEDSEIELQGFLREDKYQEVVDNLREAELFWNKRGPANKRFYDFLADENMPEVVKDCCRFLKSEAMFLILSNLTGLRLHRLAPKPTVERASSESSLSDLDEGASEIPENKDKTETKCSGVDSEGSSSDPAEQRKRRRIGSAGEGGCSSSTCSVISSMPENMLQEAGDEASTCDPRCRCEVRRWRHGNYTLGHDNDTDGCEFALDAVLFSACKGWDESFGGFTSYITKGEDEELLVLNPMENSLALVYCDKDTMKFVKYVNHRSSTNDESPEFYDFSVVYYE